MLREGFAVTAVEEGKIVAEVGGAVEFDECLWCTQAGPPLWLKDTGLPTGQPVKHGRGVQCGLFSKCHSIHLLSESLDCLPSD